ncbi:MAG: DUF177 domain-containing protein [Nitrospinae bacterium]|nr:DUF177 domain-containing protein [Nitrospinota bacterium]
MRQLVIELSEIFDEGITRHCIIAGATLGIAHHEVALTQPVDVDCQLFKVNRDVVVHGTIGITLRLLCSRCAEEFTCAFRNPLDAVFIPAEETSPKREKALEDDETEALTYVGRAINLAEMVREKVFLSVPLQPLCALRCKGLCPHCGVNWNLTTCQCVQEELESPFQLLKELRL